MEPLFARNWWVVLLRGIVAILFGIIAFIFPGITIAALALVFGAYAFLDGIFNIASAVRGIARHQRWGALLIEGIIGIAAGVFTALWPGITVLALVLAIGAWAFVTGILEIAAAVRLRKHIEGEWLLVLGGVASVIFGALLFLSPVAGAIAVTWWIGAYALVFGGLMVALSFRLRQWTHSQPPHQLRYAA
ncbi:MAG: HdeD family acid-resistance protein [Acidobacteria bacterium]|nr:HdeD family acid-resistance protein [Acidobacteriota bacterium]